MSHRTIHPDTLHRWVVDLFLAAGSSETEAQLTADHLVLANLSGHDSHGIGMVHRYVKSFLANELKLNQTVSTVVDAGTLINLDGKFGMGQSVTHQAMKIAIERAKQHGVCIMGLKNAHHLGRVGHWAEQAIAEGLCSIHFTNAVSTPWVAPHGGAEGRFVTNPFTVGIPRDGEPPIVLDFATSAIAHGKVRVAYNSKKAVPPGCLIDAAGHPTEDPAVLFEPAADGRIGALLTMAAHKGYALAMVCELLAAALTGGRVCVPDNVGREATYNSMLTIVFDPQKFGPLSAFEAQTREFVQWVKSARLVEGVQEILFPGDPERASRKARAEAIPIDDGTIAQMDESAQLIAADRRSRSTGPGPLSLLMSPT